jgi:hypothetical protein
MMAAASSLAESEGAGEVLRAENGDVGVKITRAAGVGEESIPGGVGGKEEVLRAGETVDVRHGGGGDSGDWAGGGVRRRGGTYKSSSAPTPLRSSTSQRLLTAFLVCFAGGGDGADGDIDSEGSGAGGKGGEGSGRVDGGADRIGG